MRSKSYFMSFTKKLLLISALCCVFIFGVALQKGACQFLYPPLVPFYAPVPIYPAPIFYPIAPIPYIRAPQATIILSTGITAVSPTAGSLVIGAPTVVTPTTTTTVVSTTVPTTTAAPAPLLGILGVLYASALYESPLSVANPLLFGYLSTLLL